MTVLEAQRLLRQESDMTGIEIALAAILRHVGFRVDGTAEEMSEVAAEARRQEIVIRSLRRRLESLEGTTEKGSK